ncbi:DUF3325 domain-containing protein [Halosolutus amylolyticus]|uniref:DUF3325 domain-containing protein n=1 Tax=Halosolutus amylolyticus TaxID=2932267 RepID=A0ABD5PS67_9EURY|nr:DUF3325 domain-containing protein [Halosolutus amylolyticus]
MTDPLERVRRPEYTGENRCWPCTITNSLLLTVLVGAAAWRGRRLLAAGIGLLGAGAIALRGYVVPYTPRFAPRLVAALPIDAFDHGDPVTETGSLSGAGEAAGHDEGEPAPTGEEVLTELLEADAVVAEGEEIRLSSDFQDDWRREMRTLREGDLQTLAQVADEQTPPRIEPRTREGWGRPVLVLESDDAPPVTLRRGIAVAELAAARALESRVDSGAIRRAAGRPLRSLLETCPLCDGELTVSQSTCCGDVTPIGKTPTEKLVCPDCNERFFIFEDER